MTSLTLSLQGLGLLGTLPNHIDDSPISSVFQSIFYHPLPWLFLIAGLWLAYLCWGRLFVSRFQESRIKNTQLARDLRELVRDQNRLLDEVTDDFVRERRIWSLQVTNRDTLLTDLNTRLSRLTDQRETEKRQFRERVKAEKQLNQSINQKQKEIDGLKKDLSVEGALGKRISELEATLLNRDKQISDMVFERKTADASKVEKTIEWKSRLADKDNELETLEGKVGNIQSLLDNRNREFDRLSGDLKRFDELEEQLGDREREVEYRKNRQFELENRINELELAVTEKDHVISVLETDLDEKQGARQLLDEVDVTLEKHDNELNLLREQRETVKMELGEQISELERQLADKDTEISEVQEANKDKDRQIYALKKELKSRENLAVQIDELEELAGKQEREIEFGKNEKFELETLINELELKVTEQAGSIEVLETDLTAKQGARQRVEEFDTILDTRDRELNDFRQQRENLKADLEERTTELDRQISRSKELEHRLRERELELDGVQNEKNHLVSQVEEKDGIFKRMQDFEWILGERDEDLRVANSEKERLESQVREFESARDAELDGVRFEKEGLAFQLKEMTTELESLRIDANTSEELKNRISDLEWYLGERDAELNGLRSSHEELGKHLETRENDLNSRILELEWLLGERDGELESLRKEKGDLNHQLNEQSGELNFHRAESQDREPLHQRNRDLEWFLGERDAELEALRHKQSELIRERDEQSEEVDSLKSKMENEEHTSPRIQELEWLLSERDGELENLRVASAAVPALKSELENLRTKSNKFDSLLKSKDEEIRSLHELNTAGSSSGSFAGEAIRDDSRL